MVFPHIKLFKKNKKRSGTLGLVTLPRFLHKFWRKMFLWLYCINWQNFIVWLSSLREILGNMYVVILCSPGCDVMNFEIYITLLLKPFFYKNKIKAKIQISWDRKKLLRQSLMEDFIFCAVIMKSRIITKTLL